MKMNKRYFFSVVFFTGLLLNLTACLNQYAQPTHYQLTTINQQQWATTPVKKTLLVSQPIAVQASQGTSMLYVDKDYRVSSFVNSNWNVPPAEMLFPLLVQSLQNTNYFYAVVAAPSFAYTNWRLDIHLMKLQQNFTQKPSVIDMEIEATLVNNREATVIANKRFYARVPAQTDTPYGGVVAANAACQEIMDALSAWVVETAKRQ